MTRYVASALFVVSACLMMTVAVLLASSGRTSAAALAAAASTMSWIAAMSFLVSAILCAQRLAKPDPVAQPDRATAS
jgi:hypothetical protein